jgi:FkbM family methyltransferase
MGGRRRRAGSMCPRTNDSVTIARVDLYGQEPEARLLGAFLKRLDRRSAIDVGAEHGGFVEAMLLAGAEEVHAIEPDPENAAFIRQRFRADGRVTVLEYAISDADGPLELHRSVDAAGHPLPFGHTLLARPDTDEIAWPESVGVRGRSLASLIEAGELPSRVGILKVDTEGNDLAVVAGMGGLECDVVMVEHWRELPHSLGTCPWSAEEMTSALARRGFPRFAFVEHRGEFVILKWGDATVAEGCMGNLVFMHERVVERLLLALLECACELADRAVHVGEMYATAAAERLVVIEQLGRGRSFMSRARRDR